MDPLGHYVEGNLFTEFGAPKKMGDPIEIVEGYRPTL